jgi:hypothetical protein
MKKTILLFVSLFIITLCKGQSLCNNLDFENNNLGNWAVSSGTSSFSSGGTYSMSGCCATPGGSLTVVKTTPFTDPHLGTVPHSPLGGIYVAKINDEISNAGEVARITYSLTVGPNTIFQYALAPVINGNGHSCTDNAFANVRVRDMLNNVVSYDHFVPATTVTVSCGNHSSDFYTNSTTGYSYYCWKTYTVNLSAYIGQTITIDVTAGDCDGWGHVGYCYFDAVCSAVTPTFNACSGPAGIEENVSGNNLSIYPNPAKDKFILKGIEKGSVFIMYDLLGKEILRRSELKETEEISIQTLNEGVYFYKIVYENRTERTGKVIKD